jgi:hypothetical protein
MLYSVICQLYELQLPSIAGLLPRFVSAGAAEVPEWEHDKDKNDHSVKCNGAMAYLFRPGCCHGGLAHCASRLVTDLDRLEGAFGSIGNTAPYPRTCFERNGFASRDLPPECTESCFDRQPIRVDDGFGLGYGVLETYLTAWTKAAGISREKKEPLFRSVGKGDRLSDKSMSRFDVFHMIKRWAKAAGLPYSTCCHTFRVTGITTNLENGGTLEHAQTIANHESPRGLPSSTTARARNFRLTKLGA